jgi:hypothetical protein
MPNGCRDCSHYLESNVTRSMTLLNGKIYRGNFYRDERGRTCEAGCTCYESCRGLGKGPIIFELREKDTGRH